MATQTLTHHVVPLQTHSAPVHTPTQQDNPQFQLQNAFKYHGYPAFSQFMASENDFFLLRRFGEMNARVLLHLQWRISQLEEKIHEIDESCKTDGNTQARNNSFTWDSDPRSPGHARHGLLLDLQPLLK
jgi:hypothetical protein